MLPGGFAAAVDAAKANAATLSIAVPTRARGRCMVRLSLRRNDGDIWFSFQGESVVDAIEDPGREAAIPIALKAWGFPWCSVSA